MKNLFVMVPLLVLTGTLYASKAPNLHKAAYIEIDHHISKAYVTKVQKAAKKKGFAMVANPSFTCMDAGFTKDDLFSQATRYAKKRTDGSLEIGGKGDFEAYSYKKYLHDDRQCEEKTYTKAYDPKRFGDQSYAIIMYP